MLRKILLILTLAALTACSTPASPATGKLLTVATTSLIGDVAQRVGGAHVTVRVLLLPGADPHSFEPRPQDVTALSDADVVLVNGLGLEETLEPLLENERSIVVVSDGVETLSLVENGEGGLDPHVWQDPNNIIIWARNIADAFSKADPANTDEYHANASSYIAELTALDAWIEEQVAQIPQSNRKLVTDHADFGYFAMRYGFEQIGAVIPSVSTGSAPSAQELAVLEDAIRLGGVRAVFVGSTVSADLSRRVAEDTGVRLIFLFTDSLSAVGEGAESYLEFMRYNVSAIVEALK